jgi:hypothetical protein
MLLTWAALSAYVSWGATPCTGCVCGTWTTQCQYLKDDLELWFCAWDVRGLALFSLLLEKIFPAFHSLGFAGCPGLEQLKNHLETL